MTAATQIALNNMPKLKRCNISAEANERGRAVAVAKIKADARAEYAGIYELVTGLRNEGVSLRAIAAVLNANGFKTRRGCRFRLGQVRRILDYAADATAE